MKPIVSVCMPVYNQDKFLAEAIESVLRQTYRDFEFLIIDDQSTDNSADIIQAYARKDSRIRFIINERNIGMVHNWNRCLKEASGEYIKFLFGDDMFTSPETLKKMVSVLSSDDEIALVASSRFFIDEHSAVINFVSDYRGPHKCDGVIAIKDSLLKLSNNIGEPSAVIFRKKHAERGFKTEYHQIVDLEMWFHLLEQGKFVYLTEPLCAFRIHRNQQTRRNIESCIHIHDFVFLIRDYANKPYLGLSRLRRAFLSFESGYSIWKLYSRHKRITRKTAEDVISKELKYNIMLFHTIKFFYRLYKELLRSNRFFAKLASRYIRWRNSI